MDREIQYVSLYDLQLCIKTAVERSFPESVWVVAEISEMKVNYSGHCYLELVEKGGRNRVPKAKVNAVVWRSTYGFLSEYFARQAGAPLSSGMNVLLKVDVSYHELYGFSLVVRDIDPAYTVGDMERQRQETIRQLQEDGVFDMNRELELPRVIQRVAVVSSEQAAGYRDFMKELAGNEYGYAVRATLFPAVMQGNASEEAVIAALCRIAERSDEFDAVVIIRGGGSQSDLACFDSYRLCSYVAQFPLPVITGIGHDKDTSVADLVAAVPVKTPTAVARYLIDNLLAFDRYLHEAAARLKEVAGLRTDEARTRLQAAALRLRTDVQAVIHRADKELETRGTRIIFGSRERIARQRSRLEYALAALLRSGTVRTEADRNRLDALEARLAPAARRLIGDRTATLEWLEARIDGRSPRRILAMGYSLVRNGGRTVRSIADVSPGDTVGIHTLDGVILSEVKAKRKNE